MGELVVQQLQPGGNGQLILFPYLGGHVNAYVNLVNLIPNDIEILAVNPPGHGGSSAPLLNDMDTLVDLYFQELEPLIQPGCVLFGHSMGGIVAYFLLQRFLNAKNSLKPAVLILSACNTPADFSMKQYVNMPDSELLEHLMRYNMISNEFLREQCLLDHFIPLFRSDFMILESASHCNYKALEIPSYFLWGEYDTIVPMYAVIQWKKYFSQPINFIPIKGGDHMFIHEKAHLVMEKIVEIIKSVVSTVCF